jgi:hypothetical protein
LIAFTCNVFKCDPTACVIDSFLDVEGATHIIDPSSKFVRHKQILDLPSLKRKVMESKKFQEIHNIRYLQKIGQREEREKRKVWSLLIFILSFSPFSFLGSILCGYGLLNRKH